MRCFRLVFLHCLPVFRSTSGVTTVFRHKMWTNRPETGVQQQPSLPLIDLRTPSPTPYMAPKACCGRHQLSSSGLGSLNGRGLDRDFGLWRALGFVCLGMGKDLGFGCRVHTASPMISLTSISTPTEYGVMQNHQPDVISTSLEKSARQIFYRAGPISDQPS